MFLCPHPQFWRSRLHPSLDQWTSHRKQGFWISTCTCEPITHPVSGNSVTCVTRLHSSRMHTARSLTVSPSMLCSGEGGVTAWSRGCLPGPGGVPAWSRGGACLVPGGCLPSPGGGAWSHGRGCLLGPGGYPSMHWGRPPPCEQNHRRLWKYNLAPTSLRG